MKISAEQYGKIENYIFECIDFENYGLNPEGKKAKIDLLMETFKSEYWHDYNKKYYKNDIKVGFENWLMGLPSCFNVDFENYRILEIGKEWGFDLSTEAKEDKFLTQWFKMITESVFYLHSHIKEDIKIEIKTIDVQSKEWFDKVNGNSYFSAQITLNFGQKDQQTIYLPFQYGYGSHYEDMAGKELNDLGFITLEKNQSLWRYCEQNNIALNSSKAEKQTKKNVVAYGVK